MKYIKRINEIGGYNLDIPGQKEEWESKSPQGTPGYTGAGGAYEPSPSSNKITEYPNMSSFTELLDGKRARYSMFKDKNLLYTEYKTNINKLRTKTIKYNRVIKICLRIFS